ncbi:MAG: aminomethyl-transferring glycine dehydrogenase [Thiotrichaceae bacterium]|nr:aminomethyl-transferring glycine dehydrogenase [Thiotrichaceae bacterium]
MNKTSLDALAQHNAFIQRHIGSSASDQQQMLETIGEDSMDSLMDNTIPNSIREQEPLALDAPQPEYEALAEIRTIAAKNTVSKSYIGMGYYDTFVPPVIQRNVLENPGWYTAYTPYQPEISQGRLEALLNFQQMVTDLTGMEIANASLLDEATAAAEAMALCKRANRLKSNQFFVDHNVLPQTLEVLKTRAKYFGFELIIGNPETELSQYEVFGVLVQYPGVDGSIVDLASIIDQAHSQKALVSVATDLMALVHLTSPGSLGADVVLGTSQRFGVPMGNGGPHAAFFAVRGKHKRTIPGRIIGVSKDRQGNPALRMAMQTREQHIRRDKATSNICTAQALLANMAGFYAVYHGEQGLKTIASRIHRLCSLVVKGLQQKNINVINKSWFDTLTFETDSVADILQRANDAKVNLRIVNDKTLGISIDETKTVADIEQLFTIILGDNHGLDCQQIDNMIHHDLIGIPEALRREDAILSHPTFQRYHTETEMMRYLKRLENKDLSLTHAMIPLGSCTMKLNASSELMPVSWAAFANIHPYAPSEQLIGYQQLIDQLSAWLCEVTGYDAVSVQPNSGAQGEYAGLVAINRYNDSIGQSQRNICLIPSSAHGTNPASAAMANMKIIVVACDDNGNIDINDLRSKAEAHQEHLACTMITYPSTHGVFEEDIVEACQIIHDNGGQVYMDGANMNAQVGLSKPGKFGSDVSHLNLHKTFAIPHGGGGPGVGPIGVRSHLAPFLPGCHIKDNDEYGHVSAAPFGSASILPISWMYMRTLGAQGLLESSQAAILHANYISERLAAHYPILYRGKAGRVAHECIIDIRPLKKSSGISEEDIAKRLMDYGFHAPTMSFPVAGTLMIEPTESESKHEIDRFCDAMIAIREEINKVESGDWTSEDNPLVNAPHTLVDLSTKWAHPYSIDIAAFPKGVSKASKFWPVVNRVDNVFGDRNLVCSCPPIDVYL